MTRMRDELVNNLAKLSDVDDRKSEVKNHLARERQKLTEMDDTDIQQEIRDRMKKLKGELSDIELERQARPEALSTNKAALRSQINRIHETIRRLLHEDKTLAERIRTLFREQGITIVSILTANGMAISTLMLALTGGGGAPDVPSPAPRPSDKGGVKEWVKKHLQALGRALANLAGKAAAAHRMAQTYVRMLSLRRSTPALLKPSDLSSTPLIYPGYGIWRPAGERRGLRSSAHAGILLPGIIGSIVSWLLSTLGKAASWLAENLWALVIGVGTLLLVATRDWLARPQPKRH